MPFVLRSLVTGVSRQAMNIKRTDRLVGPLSATMFASLAASSVVAGQAPSVIPSIPVNPEREAYYGDLHLHTSYSLDAYEFGTKVDPDEAYRFAKGEVVPYLGQPVQRREPLDFLAVTDHSEALGIFNELEDPNSIVSHSTLGKVFKALKAETGSQLEPNGHPPRDVAARDDKFYEDYFWGNKLPNNLRRESVSAWQREVDFANRNYKPGKFTTFIAYECSAMPDGDVLHRNVIFRGNSAPYPFTSADSNKPEDLWVWLDKIRKHGYEALAIPHNGNGSNGLMYNWVDSKGKAIGLAYAEHRQENEPLSEISQTKGSSETHPLLSPNDEFANYEILDRIFGGTQELSRPSGSYLRDALSRGLILQRKLGVNPFKYGFVGASDLHSGLSVSAQADYEGNISKDNIGGGKPTQEQAADILRVGDKFAVTSPLKTTSGNLTGVWAGSNTRESIYGALRRRETFATSGTRLRFRFFGGWGFPKELLQQRDWIATAYAKGVPMGGDLAAKPAQSSGPTFAIWAVKDPNGGNLDRAQVIKVWEEDGKQREKVFDVAWAGNRRPDPKTGKLPAVGDTVDLKTGQSTNTIGAAELKTVWKDPEFNPNHLAAYYLRVLEIPTPRWSTLLAIKNGLPLPKDVPATEQQRGWSSPIWFRSSDAN